MTQPISDFINIWDRDPFKNSYELWQDTIIPEIGWITVYWSVVFILLFGFCVWFISNRKTAPIIESISNHLLVVSLVIWLCGVLLYMVAFYREGLTWLSVLPRAIISSFKMFVVANDLARAQSYLQNDAIYMTIFSLVHFAAAFIAFLFVFKMVGYKIKSSLNIVMHKWFRAKGKVVHLFWGVNEASCLLAEDIRRNNATDTIIMIDVDEETDDNQRKATLSNITNTITIKNSEIARLNAIEALVDHCFNGPASLTSNSEIDIFGILHLKNVGDIVAKSRKSYFYILSEDESYNIATALNLQQDRRLRSMGDNRPTIFIHARRNANNEVFGHYSQYDGEAQRLKIKIVDSSYLSISTLKRDSSALPVNCVNVDRNTGLVDTPFNALIVGFGSTGQEAFKFLYEYTAFVGSDMKRPPFKCYAIDEKMNKISGLVREKMPAINEDELVLIQTSVDTEEFWALVKSIIGELNYIVIALHNDTVGLSLAVNLFKYALAHRSSELPMLKIMIRCYDNNSEKRMVEVADNINRSVNGGNVELCLYGREKELYCCKTILTDTILVEAKEFNRMYEKTNLSAEEQWQNTFGEREVVRLMTNKGMSRYHAIYDINRRIAQNLSNSLHCSTKMILMGLADDVSPELLHTFSGYVATRKIDTTHYDCPEHIANLLLNIARVEHERWVASHKLMGYVYNDVCDSAKKYHNCLCAWDDLDEYTKSYDCNVVDTTIKVACAKLR